MSVDTAFVEGIAESEDVPMLAFAITNQRMIKTEQNTLEPDGHKRRVFWFVAGMHAYIQYGYWCLSITDTMQNEVQIFTALLPMARTANRTLASCQS